MKLTGLDVSAANLLLWNGQDAEVYDIDTAGGGALPRTASFPSPSASMALHRDSIFRCDDFRTATGRCRLTLQKES
jgi:hypothetical protein